MVRDRRIIADSIRAMPRTLAHPPFERNFMLARTQSLALVGLASLLGLTACERANTDPPARSTAPASPSVPAPAATLAAASPLDLTMNMIDGTPKSLADYKGKAVLIVNVASKCGYTKQYAGLEALYKAKKDAGLVILGFPANNFGGQEPGTNKDIAAFCERDFGVSLPALRENQRER
jgi:thiol-disulfide isomerase/thioredoxin